MVLRINCVRINRSRPVSLSEALRIYFWNCLKRENQFPCRTKMTLNSDIVGIPCSAGALSNRLSSRKLSIFFYFFRPQGKVMFSQASVSHSVYNWPHSYSVIAHPCYGAVGTHPTRMLSCSPIQTILYTARQNGPIISVDADCISAA